MNQIILASHSRLAAGMKETLAFFGAPAVEVLEQTMNETGFEEKADALLRRFQGQNILVFTDLQGGSVNQIFSRKLQETSFQLVTGMNLAVLLECAFAQEDVDAAFLRRAVENARQQLCYMNDCLAAMAKDEEE